MVEENFFRVEKKKKSKLRKTTYKCQMEQSRGKTGKKGERKKKHNKRLNKLETSTSPARRNYSPSTFSLANLSTFLLANLNMRQRNPSLSLTNHKISLIEKPKSPCLHLKNPNP